MVTCFFTTVPQHTQHVIRRILHFGDIARSASSPNLSVPYHFLWGQLTVKVRTNKPGTLEELKENLRAIDKGCKWLWLITDHAYRNVLHTRETTKEMQFLKSEEHALYGILLLLCRNFFLIFNKINQNSDMK
jgi:hypothetical protein